jgi:hypothetical protein
MFSCSIISKCSNFYEQKPTLSFNRCYNCYLASCDSNSFTIIIDKIRSLTARLNVAFPKQFHFFVLLVLLVYYKFFQRLIYLHWYGIVEYT